MKPSTSAPSPYTKKKEYPTECATVVLYKALDGFARVTCETTRLAAMFVLTQLDPNFGLCPPAVGIHQLLSPHPAYPAIWGLQMP